VFTNNRNQEGSGQRTGAGLRNHQFGRRTVSYNAPRHSGAGFGCYF
jgi:hypothetical protein